jgi:hypothetical protein
VNPSKAIPAPPIDHPSISSASSANARRALESVGRVFGLVIDIGGDADAFDKSEEDGRLPGPLAAPF